MSSLFWDVTRRWLVVTDVSGQPIGPTFKGRAVRNSWRWDRRLYRNVADYQSALRKHSRWAKASFAPRRKLAMSQRFCFFPCLSVYMLALWLVVESARKLLWNWLELLSLYYCVWLYCCCEELKYRHEIRKGNFRTSHRRCVYRCWQNVFPCPICFSSYLHTRAYIRSANCPLLSLSNWNFRKNDTLFSLCFIFCWH